jgi:glycosyltransferase involved in cell wall biosynthesis
MLKMIKKLYQIDKRYKLVLIGDAAKPNDMKLLKSMVRSMNLEHAIIFTGKLDKKALQEYLWYSDVCVSPIPPTKYYIISSPTKMYEYMGHGVPVIANREVYEQAKVIKESGGGLAVNYDVEEFVQAIIHLAGHKEKRFNMGERGKQYIFENYSYKKIAENILPYLIH